MIPTTKLTMEARVNKVIEPITVVVVNGREYYTVQLVNGDLIKREGIELVVEKGDGRFHIPDKTMEVIKTVAVPTLDVYIKTYSHGQIAAMIEDSEFFTSEEIAVAVKEAIDENRSK